MDDADRRLLRHLGYGGFPPDLEATTAEPRPAAEVVDRWLALSVVAAAANGLTATLPAA